MSGVMKLDHYHGAAIQDPCHGLPWDLNHPNAAEVPAPLWDQDGSLSGTLLRTVNLT